MRKRLALVWVAVLALGIGVPMSVGAQTFSAEDFERGPRFRLPEGQEAQIWNPAKQKLLEGGPLIGGTVRVPDARTYCAMASAGYDFVWVEMQHEASAWENVARMWRTCPGPAAPGARIAYADEREIQHATDMGALVIVVPTVDSVEEAQEAIKWTYFPPLGRRSAGGGQGPSEMWNDVPGGYRQTWNENVVLILMIETLEGVEAAREIAKLPGATAIFAASGDLGNFSGYGDGDPEYDGLIAEVLEAAEEAGIHACAPLRWADRQAELQQAQERYDSTGGGTSPAPSLAAQLLPELTAQCGSITYEADCYAAVRRAATTAVTMPANERARVSEALQEIIAANPNHADRIREIATRAGLALGDS